MAIIKVVQRTTRPSVDIPFFEQDNETKQYRIANYVQAGKILYTKLEFSEDQLEHILTTIFLDEASRNQYVTDPVIAAFRLRRNDYNTKNSIRLDVSITVHEE